MSLATRCPDCKTLFPTTAAQLQEQNGHITCGHCGCMFSGIDHLTPADEDSWNTGATLQADVGGTAPNGDGQAGSDTAKTSRLKRPAWLVRLQHTVNAWPRFARRWTLCLLVLLLWQLLWWQRLAIANALPILATPLQKLSQALGTDLARPASSSVKIMASSLKSLDNDQLALEIRIRNASSGPSRWPVLELALLNSKRDVVTSTALGVHDYAVTGNEHPGGTLKAGEDAELVAFISTAALNKQALALPVTGFKLAVVDSVPTAPASNHDHH
jgi:predicted Zn finger-like uncharacterized protein